MRGRRLRNPRDLFDVMQLFAHEGITPGIRRAFVVYLASSNRPVHEVLFPPPRDIRHDFEYNFQGMMVEPVPLDALLAARERMMRELQQGLHDNERRESLGCPLNEANCTRVEPSAIHSQHAKILSASLGFETCRSIARGRDITGPDNGSRRVWTLRSREASCGVPKGSKCLYTHFNLHFLPDSV